MASRSPNTTFRRGLQSLRKGHEITPLSCLQIWSGQPRMFTASARAASVGDASRTDPILKAIETRRTYYSLKNTSPIPDSRIPELVNTVAKYCPSSHNSQSTRLVVLLKEEHAQLWDMALEVLRSIIPADKFAPTEQKVKDLRAGYGTILFYEDSDTVLQLQADWPLYKEKFPSWSDQTNAMHQVLLWTALESEGLGCNLQHYDPLIDQKIIEMWGIDKKWNLKGQMVFGEITGEPKKKDYKSLEERVCVYGQ